LTRPAAVLVMALTGPDGFAHAQGDRALGEYLSSECVTCHQVTGRYEGIPPIVGWPDAVFVEIMGEYRAKKRANPIMQTIAVRLSEEEITALAAYFGSLQHRPTK
jgi:cytochrome c553